MSKITVPTCANEPVDAGVPVALMVNMSWSGRLKRTAWSQLRPRRSSQWPETVLNLTIRPVSGPVTWTHVPLPGQLALVVHEAPSAVPPRQWSALLFGAGRPPGIVTPLMLHDPTPDPP